MQRKIDLQRKRRYERQKGDNVQTSKLAIGYGPNLAVSAEYRTSRLHIG